MTRSMARLLQIAGLAVAPIFIQALPSPASADQILAVEIVTVEKRPAQITYELTGTIEATHSVPVSFRNGGRIVTLVVDVGDNVLAGQVLASVEDVQPNAALQAALAQLVAAEAGLTQARLARDRVSELLGRGASTRAELLDADEALLAAMASRDQVEAALKTARQAVADTEITAPFDGIVTERSAEPGQVIGAGQPVLTLAPEKQREAVFYAPNHRLLDSLLGDRVTLIPINEPGRRMVAVVSEISPLADIRTGTVAVKARLEPGSGEPGLGEPVTSHVTVETEPAFAVPWSALVAGGANPAVWTVDPASGAVALTEVEVTRYTSAMVDIAAGLKDGDLVVAAGSQLLYPGRIVRAVGEGQ
ncbi:MAG: efflux RND transporter periplasmic adaptor subunit [Rhodobacteraceae bacterium]|nr:efflux RND transporter periplasmic adaptor subunit [Paracoccaceae bacterium]